MAINDQWRNYIFGFSHMTCLWGQTVLTAALLRTLLALLRVICDANRVWAYKGSN